MASLKKLIEEGISIDIDKGQLEIDKKVAKEQVKKFLGGFTGIHSSSKKEQDENVKKRSDEYRKEHNKMFAGYDGTMRKGIKTGSEYGDNQKMRINGIEAVSAEKEATGPRSRMRVGGEIRSGQRGATALYSEKRRVPDRVESNRLMKGTVATPNSSNVKERDYSGMDDTLLSGGRTKRD